MEISFGNSVTIATIHLDSANRDLSMRRPHWHESRVVHGHGPAPETSRRPLAAVDSDDRTSPPGRPRGHDRVLGPIAVAVRPPHDHPGTEGQNARPDLEECDARRHLPGRRVHPALV